MVRRAILLFPTLACIAAAFTGQPLVSRSPSASYSLSMGGAQGYATSLEGKKNTVTKVQSLLDSSQMVFTIPAGSITVAQTQALRRSMPSGTTVQIVKNKLMARAVEGTDYAVATSLLQGANAWFFIEEDIGGTLKAYNAFLKNFGKRESHPILGGVIEGNTYDAAGVEAIGKLPSKQDLYAKIAGSIKAVPTKVARVIKAPNSKLARAIKLATDEVHK
jgi:large subunit ribosomal protein L10